MKLGMMLMMLLMSQHLLLLVLLLMLHLADVSVLSELVTSMHSLRDKHNISSHCVCTNKQNFITKLPATNGVSQVV